jgi:hypothetical protein
MKGSTPPSSRSGRDPVPENDGTDAVPGEPFVRERFALNRLACSPSGPSAGRSGEDIDDLRENFGFTRNSWTRTIDNIEKYFGLKWNPAGIGPIARPQAAES